MAVGKLPVIGAFGKANSVLESCRRQETSCMKCSLGKLPEGQHLEKAVLPIRFQTLVVSCFDCIVTGESSTWQRRFSEGKFPNTCVTCNTRLSDGKTPEIAALKVADPLSIAAIQLLF